MGVYFVGDRENVSEAVILNVTYSSYCPLQLLQGPVGLPGAPLGNRHTKSPAKLVKAKENLVPKPPRPSAE